MHIIVIQLCVKPIMLHLLICLISPLYCDLMNLTSQKITQAFLLMCTWFCRNLNCLLIQILSVYCNPVQFLGLTNAPALYDDMLWCSSYTLYHNVCETTKYVKYVEVSKVHNWKSRILWLLSSNEYNVLQNGKEIVG